MTFRLRRTPWLELDDVSFDRRTIAFRPNAWRRLKTRTFTTSQELGHGGEALVKSSNTPTCWAIGARSRGVCHWKCRCG
jgi:hypothetical protein